MHLVPREVSFLLASVTVTSIQCSDLKLDKLVISQVGLLAQRRLARGVRLNHTEATVWAPLSPQQYSDCTDMHHAGPDCQCVARGLMHIRSRSLDLCRTSA